MHKFPQVVTAAATLLAAAFFCAAQEESGLERVEANPSATAIAPSTEASAEGPVIQLALLLDTSSSMSGLIDQAKTQLWSVVNAFISARQDGKTPVVQVALYEYGNNRLPAEAMWIRKIQPLTRDLDTLSRELFALQASTVSGGNEYCGAAVMESVRDLAWDPAFRIYKAIFIAGNEGFSQGPVAPGDACKAAITRGVIVNTLFCRAETVGVEAGWKEGALRADGEFTVINQNQVVAQIDAPQDGAILKLNDQLNDTYIAFGLAGREKKANQIAQDSNAVGIAEANLVNRARTKASANYFNPTWDIVDASQQRDFRWAEVEKESLPAAWRGLTTEEVKTRVAQKIAERAKLQAEILALTAEREVFVREKRRALGEDRSLGDAVANLVRKQAMAKGVHFREND